MEDAGEKLGPGRSRLPNSKAREFARGLNLFDSTMVVDGAMIGSGIFIVPALGYPFVS
jgi:hypothetical protein